MDLSSYETITILLQNERHNQLRLKLLSTTVYHTYTTLPLATIFSMCLPKCIRNKGCFIFFTRDREKNNKKHFLSVEIGNEILMYINIKQVFQIEIDYTRY